MLETMLVLKDKDLIASGDNRNCFFHPDNNNLCIKVLHPNRHLKIQNREETYYKALRKRNISWSRLAEFSGAIETNHGKGLVFEIIRDYDGKISKTLDFYLLQDEQELNKTIITEIEDLKSYLFKEAIVFRDLITLNILLKRTSASQYSAVIIDGIGHNDFLPICNYSKYFSRQKIVRIWNRKKKHWFDKYPSIKDDIHFY